MGGAETVALQINAFLNRRSPGTGRLLLPSNSDVERHARAGGLVYRGYSLSKLGGRSVLRSLWENVRIQGLLRKESSPILHVHNPYVFRLLRPALAIGNTRTVLHLHLDYSEQDLRWALEAPPDLIILCAGFMRQRVHDVLPRGHAKRTRVLVIRNAIDLQQFARGDGAGARREMGVAADQPLYLMAANLAAHKGQATAIRAMSCLRRRGLNPMLWLVGEDRESSGYAEELKQLAAELDVAGNVRFLGFRTDVPALLSAADAFLLPSVREGLPLSILEAQAAKVPVLAAPTAGIPEVIGHGQTGFLIEADDAAGYANVLESLLQSPLRKDEVVEAAYRQVLTTADMQGYCEQVSEAYESLSA